MFEGALNELLFFWLSLLLHSSPMASPHRFLDFLQVCMCVCQWLYASILLCIHALICRRERIEWAKGKRDNWEKSAAGGEANRPTSAEHTFRDDLFESIVHPYSQFTRFFKSLACFWCALKYLLQFFMCHNEDVLH